MLSTYIRMLCMISGFQIVSEACGSIIAHMLLVYTSEACKYAASFEMLLAHLDHRPHGGKSGVSYRDSFVSL